MNPVRLASELLLLGAECSVREASNGGCLDSSQVWAAQDERWDDWAARARQVSQDSSALPQPIGDLNLSFLSQWLLLTCAAVEFHVEAAAAASLIAEDERLHLVTPLTYARLASRAFAVSYEEALAEALPGGQGRRLGVVEEAPARPGRPLTQQGLRLASGELRALLGRDVEQAASVVDGRDLRTGYLCQDPAIESVHPRDRVVGAAKLLMERGSLCVRSESSRSGRQLGMDLAAILRQRVVFIEAQEERPSQAVLERLRSDLVILDWRGAQLRSGDLAAVLRLAPGYVAALIDPSFEAGTLSSISIPPLGYRESLRVWNILGLDEEAAPSLASRFRIDLVEARTALRDARNERQMAGLPSDPVGVEEVAVQVREQGARRMGQMVTRLQSDTTLDQLIVPPALREQLGDVLGWYRSSSRVEGMGMDRGSALGRGLICLLSGPPGVGKTFCAQCLANEWGLNLYRIDLSQVVSKYIGETEKCLSTIFAEAESGHGVLLFDEADSLFGRRSEVKDAHDRYANVEVGYLLQRLESYDGVALLATNLRSNMDSAFIRRIRFLLEFPMPDEDARTTLWKQSLPDAPFLAEDLDVDWFAQRFALSGGNIHNIGLAAAHLAAGCQDRIVTIEHLVRATHRELEKSGLSRKPSAFGPLAQYLPEAMS